MNLSDHRQQIEDILVSNNLTVSQIDFEKIFHEIEQFIKELEWENTSFVGDDPNYIEKVLRWLEEKILNRFSGPVRAILKIILDVIIQKILDETAQYNKVVADATKGIQDEFAKLNALKKEVEDKAQKFHQNMWFQNFPFKHIKLPDAVRPFVPFPSDIYPTNWSLFGGIFEGLAQLVLGIVEPIFTLIIEKIIEPFLAQVFAVLIAFIPVITRLVDICVKVIVFVICLIMRVFMTLDSMLPFFELLSVFLFISFRTRNPSTAGIVVGLLLVFIGSGRPYPSILTAIVDSLPDRFRHCTANQKTRYFHTIFGFKRRA